MVQPTLGVNSMVELGSDSRNVQCLDNDTVTLMFTVFAKNSWLRNKMVELRGELAGFYFSVD